MPQTRTLKLQTRKLLSWAGERRRHFYSLTLAQPLAASTRTYALTVSGRQARAFPAILPNKEFTCGIHANYLTTEGLSTVTFWKVPGPSANSLIHARYMWTAGGSIIQCVKVQTLPKRLLIPHSISGHATL